MVNAILILMKKYLPPKIYGLFRFLFRLVAINPGYAFGPVGFFQKMKIDLYELWGEEPFVVNYGKIKFYNKGWGALTEKNGYWRLKNLRNVLDLGGFTGDSALILSSQNNEKVFVFEPEKEKFSWILKNIKLNHFENKIKAYNYAVVSSDIKEIMFNKEGEFSASSSIDKNIILTQTEVVSCINIKKVMKLAEFDGLKCDVEGGEFQIIKYFLKNPQKFNFKQGVIEWHFTKENFEQNKILLGFLRYLKENDYRFFFYPQNKPLKVLNEKEELDNIIKQKYSGDLYANMFYFEKGRV